MAELSKQAQWVKDHTYLLAARLTLKYDADIIEYFADKPSKSGEIKRLVRAEIARNKAKK